MIIENDHQKDAPIMVAAGGLIVIGGRSTVKETKRKGVNCS